jgi:hypothetical protein
VPTAKFIDSESRIDVFRAPGREGGMGSCLMDLELLFGWMVMMIAQQCKFIDATKSCVTKRPILLHITMIKEKSEGNQEPFMV